MFSADFLNLIFYCAQQLGVTLGVGAETIMLAAYLISMRDGVVDEKETQYAQAIKRVMGAALWCIVLSGLGITALHVMAGEGAVVFTPAFLFKWLLILLVVMFTVARHRFATSSMVEGVIGGTWYALLLVHILAPVTGWINLLTLYAIWLVGFVMCWEMVVLMRKDTKPTAKKITPPPVQASSPPPPTEPRPRQTITLGPDLHRATPAPMPPPAPPPPPPPAPIAPPPLAQPIVQKIQSIPPPTNIISFRNVAQSPAGKVTDTPFLPAVPALQPIPTGPSTTFTPPAPPATSVPITTMPGGTSTPPAPVPGVPLVQEGLSAMNIMPKAPPAPAK